MNHWPGPHTPGSCRFKKDRRLGHDFSTVVCKAGDFSTSTTSTFVVLPAKDTLSSSLDPGSSLCCREERTPAKPFDAQLCVCRRLHRAYMLGVKESGSKNCGNPCVATLAGRGYDSVEQPARLRPRHRTSSTTREFGKK